MSKEKNVAELNDEDLQKVSGGVDGCPKGLDYISLNSCRNCDKKKVVTETSSFIYYDCPFAGGQIAITNTNK